MLLEIHQKGKQKMKKSEELSDLSGTEIHTIEVIGEKEERTLSEIAKLFLQASYMDLYGFIYIQKAKN